MPSHESMPYTYSQVSEQYNTGNQEPTVLTKRRKSGEIVTARLIAETDENGRRFVKYDTAEGPAKKALDNESLTDEFQAQLADELASDIPHTVVPEQGGEVIDDDVEITRRRVKPNLGILATDMALWEVKRIPIRDEAAPDAISGGAETATPPADEVIADDEIADLTREAIGEADAVGPTDDVAETDSSDDEKEKGNHEAWERILTSLKGLPEGDDFRRLKSMMGSGEVEYPGQARNLMERVGERISSLRSMATGFETADRTEIQIRDDAVNMLTYPVSLLGNRADDLRRIAAIVDEHQVVTPDIKRELQKISEDVVSGLVRLESDINSNIPS